MAFTKQEEEQYEAVVRKFIDRRRPSPEIRSELDIGCSIRGQSIEIHEIRPQWNKPVIKRKYPVAKTTWVQTQKKWKIYWMRADLKWHAYDPLPEVERLEEFLEEVDRDPGGCFWG
ncbi:MAG: DUF3024 domain-containing protein [Balneolaceae bacterium]